MPARLTAFGLSAASAVLAAGCYTVPYQPSYPMYQGPVAPINTLQPGPYYQPGQPLPSAPSYNAAPSYNGNLAPIPSSGVSPTPANPTPTPTFEGGGGTGSGGFDPGGGGTDIGNDFSGGGVGDPYYTAPGAGGAVPDYGDPMGDFQDPVRPADPGADFDFGPSASLTPPAGNPAADAEPMPLSFADPTAGPDPFAAAPMQPIEQTAYVPPTAGETRLDPYGYEAGTYAWLRGVVSKDAADGSWSITYDLEPEPFDALGGNVTLAGDARLDALSDGDVVLVEGQVDRATADRLGKPVYRVGQVVPLDVSVPE